ncbi:MAG: outer membrane beta-barrel protein [Owenweeksia sp.]
MWGQAGPDFTRSFNDGKVATGWLIGINYTYRFAQRWSFEAGLNYNARTATGITLSSDSVFYNFGQEVIHTEIRHQRLDYFEVPLVINLSLDPQHQVGAGVYTSALFNVNREIERTRTPFKGNVEVTTEKENGTSPNFNTMDYGFTGSYFYRYSPQISLGLQLKYGMTDITPNRTDVLSPFHRNSNARVIIRYRLY